MRRRTIRNLAAAAGLGAIAIALLPDNTPAPEPVAQPAEPVCAPPEAGVVRRLTYNAAGLSLMPPRQEGLRIALVMKGSTAHDAGIQPGSFITHIDGQNICGMARADIDRAMMDIAKGTVALTIQNIYDPNDTHAGQHTLKLEKRRPLIDSESFDAPYRTTPVPAPSSPVPLTYPDFYTVKTDLAEVFQNSSMDKTYPERLAQGSCITVMKDPQGGDLAQVWIQIPVQRIISQTHFSWETSTTAYMKTADLAVRPDRPENIAESCNAIATPAAP